jgi:DNA-binding NarL/FixJ family response regulator/Tfp pilus assembly protein PilZ
MFLLATGCSTVPVIAERLSLSQNTIHNHFKNIFRRTRTNSKAGLLALFINETLGRQASVEPFIRRPRVLLVEPDDAERVRTIEALEARGVETAWELQPDRVLERIRERRVDAVVIDGALADLEQRELLPRILDRFGRHPVVLVASSDPDADREAWKARGAGDLFAKPVSIDRMLFAILQHHVESDYDRSRLVRVETDLPARIDGTLKGSIGNLGFGGAFVTLPEDTLREPATLSIGSEVRVSFDLEDRDQLDLNGTVRWRRDASRPASQAGIGVEFVDCVEAERDAIEDYVRKRKLGNAIGFDAQRSASAPA